MKIDRRCFLRGATSIGAMASGGLLLGHAFGQALACEANGAANKRFVVYVTGNGVEDSQWPHDFDMSGPLPVMLDPLEPHREKLLLVQGIGCRFAQALHGNHSSTLSCTHNAGDIENDAHYDRPGGITFDRFLATHLQGSTPIDSLAYAHPMKKQVDSPNAPPRLNCVAADGPDALYIPEWDPVSAYDSYFGDGDLNAEQLAEKARQTARRERLLRFAEGGTAGLRSTLRGQEKDKLLQLEESLTALADRLDLDFTPCAEFDRPEPIDLADAVFEVREEFLRAYMDLTYNALLSGLTNVVHVSNGGGGSSHSKYEFLDDNKGLHLTAATHPKSDPALRRLLHQVDFHQIRYLWERLEQTPEGDGTMADNTLVMWINTGGRDHHQGAKKAGHNVAILGDLNGILDSGKVIQVDKEDHELCDLYVALAHALGVPIDAFGDESVNKGPLDGVLA